MKIGVNVRNFGDVAFLALLVALLVESAVGRPAAMWVAGMHATYVLRRP